MVYDDGDPDSYLTLPQNDTVAVKFTQPAEHFQLAGMIIYSDTPNLTKIRVWVMDDSNNTIMDPINPLHAMGLPPYDVSFGGAGPIFTEANASDFYIVVEWYNESQDFGIGIDNTTISGNSYTNQSGTWQQYALGNIMIRARIADIEAPTFDHIPLQFAVMGHDLSLSVEVSDEFGVESVVIAYRDAGTNNTFDTVLCQLANGTNLKGIWYGTIPGENVTAAGVEYYIWATDVGFNQRYYGNASVPFSVTSIEVFEIPVYLSVVILCTIGIAAIVLYVNLPEYEGEDKG